MCRIQRWIYVGINMKLFDVRLLVPLNVEAESAEDAIEKVRQDLGDYWLLEHCFSVTEVDDNE